MSISSALAVSMMIGHGAASPQAPADLEPVELGHHHVQDDEVEGLLVEARERLAPVGGSYDVVTLLVQRIGEEGLDRLLVVGKQDARRPFRHRDLC